MNRTGLGLAVGAGYLLGRTKKLKLAFAVGTLVAGKRMHLSPKAVADLVSQQLLKNPQFKEIGDTLRQDLRGVGKAASGAMVERQIDAIADRLHGRTAQVRDQLSGVAPDLSEDEDDESERDEEPEEEETGTAEDEADEEPSDEDEADDEADDDEADEEQEEAPAPAKRTAKKAPAKKSAAKKAPGRTPPAKKTAQSQGGTAGKKTAAKKTTGKKTAAKKATAARGAGRSTRARLPKGGGE
ncbi:DNA primase [Streptomyces sp. NPDC097941]|uniref:DNA primase n=1 Tax=Streptomyces sp. NPDC097941 TaxID=3155685 RepID=UPI00331D95EF